MTKFCMAKIDCLTSAVPSFYICVYLSSLFCSVFFFFGGKRRGLLKWNLVTKVELQTEQCPKIRTNTSSTL